MKREGKRKARERNFMGRGEEKRRKENEWYWREENGEGKR